MTKKKFSAVEQVDAIKQKALDDAAKNWRPQDMWGQSTSMGYYRRTGRAPPGERIYVMGKCINDKGENEPVQNPFKSPPKGWKGVA